MRFFIILGTCLSVWAVSAFAQVRPEFIIRDKRGEEYTVRPVRVGDGAGLEALERADPVFNHYINDMPFGEYAQNKDAAEQACTVYENACAGRCTRAFSTWVLLTKSAPAALVGSFSGFCDSVLMSLIHPDFRNRGLKTNALRTIITSYLTPLSLNRASSYVALLYWPPSVQWRPVANICFKGLVDCDNFPSLRANMTLVREGLLSVAVDVEDDEPDEIPSVLAFYYPPKAQNLELLTILNTILNKWCVAQDDQIRQEAIAELEVYLESLVF